MAEMDAVVTGQVARRLRRGHQVIGRDGKGLCGSDISLIVGAEPFVDFEAPRAPPVRLPASRPPLGENTRGQRRCVNGLIGSSSVRV